MYRVKIITTKFRGQDQFSRIVMSIFLTRNGKQKVQKVNDITSAASSHDTQETEVLDIMCRRLRVYGEKRLLASSYIYIYQLGFPWRDFRKN